MIAVFDWVLTIDRQYDKPWHKLIKGKQDEGRAVIPCRCEQIGHRLLGLDQRTRNAEDLCQSGQRVGQQRYCSIGHCIALPDTLERLPVDNGVNCIKACCCGEGLCVESTSLAGVPVQL